MDFTSLTNFDVEEIQNNSSEMDSDGAGIVGAGTAYWLRRCIVSPRVHYPAGIERSRSVPHQRSLGSFHQHYWVAVCCRRVAFFGRCTSVKKVCLRSKPNRERYFAVQCKQRIGSIDGSDPANSNRIFPLIAGNGYWRNLAVCCQSSLKLHLRFYD